MHKSRLGALIIDCKTDNLAREAEFWAAALGSEVRLKPGQARYIDLQSNSQDPHVLLQQVDHPSRVHIDIESDDIAAEVKRLQKLGATVIEEMERWTVMQAPSGHRFCIIGPRREGFEEQASVWE